MTRLRGSALFVFGFTVLAACGNASPAALQATTPQKSAGAAPVTVEARCCSVPCWPGMAGGSSLLGHGCDEAGLRPALEKKARAAGGNVAAVSCHLTSDTCNATCESAPGEYFVCDATVAW